MLPLFMKCVFCNSSENRVVDSRNQETTNSIRRRRECLKCAKRFTSYETVEVIPFLVHKSSGGTQPFDPDKLKSGIIKACEKRPVSEAQVDKIVATVEKAISSRPDQEITSRQIAEMVMRDLKAIDKMAHLRYAIVHERFSDVNSLISFVKTLEAG